MLQPTGYLNVTEAAKLLGVTRNKFYDLLRTGEFPDQTTVGGIKMGWLPATIAAWQQMQVEIAMAPIREKLANAESGNNRPSRGNR